VASGPNAWYPHYHKGTRTMRAGEWLLFDFAPDVGYYMSDLTRMMPVNGRFTPQQREIYGFYKVAYRAILDRIRPGVTAKQVKAEAVTEMRRVLGTWNFSRDIDRRAATEFVDSYARGADASSTTLGHGVGMATHDVGDYSGVLRPGMVFTIEPALRIPEEQTYIRMEDLIIIRENGIEIVSDFVPMESEAIEALMAEPGLLQTYPRNEILNASGN
jgi:Xaa-Pro aminopeptidase